MLRALARAAGRTPSHWPALAAAALWLTLPLLASSSLMVIQRMATLSGTFVLIGLLAYLYFRGQLVQGRRGLAGMTFSVAAGTLLAALCKENGALLPMLVLVAEATILARPAAVDTASWWRWCVVVLVLPSAAILSFLLFQLPYDTATVLERDYTGLERLMTEARVLWLYLGNALVGQPGSLGPFHDDLGVSRSLFEPTTFLAVVASIAAISAAIVYRRRYSLVAFATLWFVAAHLLESTTVPLYLYFEHRNYIPLLGPAFAVSIAVFSVTGRYRNPARALLCLVIAINAALLFASTSMWGMPRVATAAWYEASPASAAAAGHYAQQQMAHEGLGAGVETLRAFVARHPEHAYLRLAEVTALCRLVPDHDQRATIDELEQLLPGIKFTKGLGPMLDELLGAASALNCVGVDTLAIRRLLAAALRNPRFAINAGYMSYHHQLTAKLAFGAGDFDAAVQELEKAKEFVDHDDLNLMLVSTLATQGRTDEARAVLARARESRSMDPRKRFASTLKLDDLERYIDAVESNRRPE